MKRIRAPRGVLKIFYLLISLLSVLGFTSINFIEKANSLFLPLVNRLAPASEYWVHPILITEVMFNPLGSEPGDEWIELYNRSPREVSLEGFKLGDSEVPGDLEGMYLFPDGSQVGPGDTVLVAHQSVSFLQAFGFKPEFELVDTDAEVEDLVKYRSWSGGTINLNNEGDEILLLEQEDLLVDSVSWGSSNFAFDPPAPKTDNGMSLARVPGNYDSNQADDWLVLSEPGPGEVNLDLPTPPLQTETATQPACTDTSILISEVLYDPADRTEPYGEWMELYNFGGAQISLECFLLGDEETNGGAEGMVSFSPGSAILPGEVVVIANSADEFLATYGKLPDFELSDSNESVSDLDLYPDWASGHISLSNSGDELLLMLKSGTVVDAVSWGSSIFAFNPSVPAVIPGHSIARQPADIDTDTALDWLEVSIPQPGEVVLISATPSPTSSPFPPTDTPSPQPPSPTSTWSPSPTLTKTPTSTNTPTHTPTPTQTHTATSTPIPTIELVINEIHADPDLDLGDANLDGDVDFSDDEFIEIVNISPMQVDLSGWILGDRWEYRHTFPQGTLLAPNCSIVIFGGGTPSGNFGNSQVQISSNGRLELNEDFETVYIYDPQLVVVGSLSYGYEAGDNQSITRDPDITGSLPLVKHSLATGSGGTLFSPGTMIDGSPFSGCPE